MTTSALNSALNAGLVDAIDQALPQTQCTRCAYPDCRTYAQAIAQGEADINQCPPGGQEGVIRLSRITGRPALPLNPEHGSEGPRLLAVIDEDWCIGCTLCIDACPVDCIVGSAKHMHVVVDAQCTGCELCVPACPVDCISLKPVTPDASGWSAWSPAQAQEARERYRFREQRRQREQQEHAQRLQAKAEHKLAHLNELTKGNDVTEQARKRSVIEAALARARAKQGGQ